MLFQDQSKRGAGFAGKSCGQTTMGPFGFLLVCHCHTTNIETTYMSGNESHASSSSIERQDQLLHERAPLLSESQGSGSRKDKGKATIPPRNYTFLSQNEADRQQVPTTRRPRRNKACFVLSILSTLIGLTIIVLLLFAPNIAQRYLRDGAEVSFEEASILNLSDPKSLDIHVVGQIILNDPLFGVSRKASGLFGQVSTLQSALDVYKAGSVMDVTTESALGTIALPELVLGDTDRTTNFSFTTQFRIGNNDELAAFCRDAVNQKKVVWRVKGPVGVKVGWLPKNFVMDLEKNVTLEGGLL